jgi:hypothetical protein
MTTKIKHNSGIKFKPGQMLSTPGALEEIARAGQEPLFFLQKHLRGDWGEVCEEDKMLNDQSLVDGSRILSTYKTLLGVKIWIITKAMGDDGYRAATTILLPDEY